MPEWLIEHGIGETRAALVEDGRILEARIELEGSVPSGSIVEGRLTSIGKDGQITLATDERGTEYLIPKCASGLSQGSRVNIEVTREAIPGSEPWKRPLGRLTESSPKSLPSLESRLNGRLAIFPGGKDELGEAGWNDLLGEAASGIIPFPSGQLQLFATPAMTLIDVDALSPSAELLVRGAGEAARAILRLDISGNIGVDLPTVREKSARASAVDLVDEMLSGKRFERTAINGFGFLQIIKKRSRPSIIELAQDRALFEARALLRRAIFEPAGSKRLVAHPAVIGVLAQRRNWTDQLARQTGGIIELRSDPALPMSGGYAENL